MSDKLCLTSKRSQDGHREVCSAHAGSERTAQSEASGRAQQAPAAAFPHTHLHRDALPTRVLHPEGVPHAQSHRRVGPGAGNGGAEAQGAQEAPGPEHAGVRGCRSAGTALFTRAGQALAWLFLPSPGPSLQALSSASCPRKPGRCNDRGARGKRGAAAPGLPERSDGVKARCTGLRHPGRALTSSR